MSTEPEPTQPTEPTEPTAPGSLLPPDDEPPPGTIPGDEPPAEPDPGEVGPEPEEDKTPPPPPDQPGQITVEVEPGTWYEVTSVCATPTCVNLNTTTTEPEVYSNAGTLRIGCARCGQLRPILDYRKLDPQPEMS